MRAATEERGRMQGRPLPFLFGDKHARCSDHISEAIYLLSQQRRLFYTTVKAAATEDRAEYKVTSRIG